MIAWLRNLHARRRAPRPLRWTQKLVERFWTGVSQTRLAEHNFAREGGKGLIATVAHLLPKDGKILDFGAGDGEIAEMLCERGHQVAVYEPSKGRTRHLQEKLGKHPSFLGAVDMRSRDQFDVVLMIEVIEHVLDEQLDAALVKLGQFTRPGGILIISTPNNEDLELSMCYDPLNNKYFHRWQHVRSFSHETLVALLTKYGFEEIVSHELDYSSSLYVPYDEIWGLASVQASPPSHVVAVRANLPVKIASQSNLLYVGRLGRRVVVPTLAEKAGQLKQRLAAASARAFDLFKRQVKKRLGSRYEPWLRRPYLIAVKPVVRRLVKAVKDPGVILPALERRMLTALNPRIVVALWKGGGTAPSLGRRLKTLVTVQFPAGFHLLLEHVSIRAQLWLITLEDKSQFYPLRFFVAPLLKLFIIFSDHHYRRTLRRFGAVLMMLPGNGKPARQSLLLMIGTLGPGGAERQAVYTLLELARRGIRSLALAAVYLQTETQRFYMHRLEAAGIPAFELHKGTSNDNSQLLNGVLRAVRELPPDLADVADYVRTLLAQRPHTAHLWLDEVNVKGGLAAVAAGVPNIVLSARSLPPPNFKLYKPYMREGYRWLLRRPGVKLICNSVAGARAYEGWLGMSSGSIGVVHNGFDFDERLIVERIAGRGDYRRRYGIPPEAPVLGTVMRLSEEKRPLLFAKIAKCVRRNMPGAHFLVVGDGPLKTELERWAAAADLTGHLHLVGHERQPLAAIAAMDLFLLTSRAEGLPNVLIEAQALGVPVVTTRVGGAPETLDEGRTGWTLVDGDPEAAGSLIARLLNDKPCLQQAGTAAHDFVKQHFTVERMIDETLEIYGPQFYGSNHREAAFQERTA